MFCVQASWVQVWFCGIHTLNTLHPRTSTITPYTMVEVCHRMSPGSQVALRAETGRWDCMLLWPHLPCPWGEVTRDPSPPQHLPHHLWTCTEVLPHQCAWGTLQVPWDLTCLGIFCLSQSSAMSISGLQRCYVCWPGSSLYFCIQNVPWKLPALDLEDSYSPGKGHGAYWKLPSPSEHQVSIPLHPPRDPFSYGHVTWSVQLEWAPDCAGMLSASGYGPGRRGLELIGGCIQIVATQSPGKMPVRRWVRPGSEDIIGLLDPAVPESHSHTGNILPFLSQALCLLQPNKAPGGCGKGG
jgi:hypothetical protein